MLNCKMFNSASLTFPNLMAESRSVWDLDGALFCDAETKTVKEQIQTPLSGNGASAH